MSTFHNYVSVTKLNPPLKLPFAFSVLWQTDNFEFAEVEIVATFLHRFLPFFW